MEQHSVMEEPFGQQLTIITVNHNGKYRVVAKGFTYPIIEKSILKMGDTYHPSDFIIGHRRNKVKDRLTYKNGVKTHTVVFEAGGIVSGRDKEGIKFTYTSKGGATIHLGTNNIVTKIEGAVYITKEKL